MNIRVLKGADRLIGAAADAVVGWLLAADTRNLMVAGGNTPLPLYREIAARNLELAHLNVFPLDEYVGVPPDDPRTCSNLLRTRVAEAWKIPSEQFFPLSTLERDAEVSIREHERRIEAAGGLDVIVLGLGQNGHLGFNEPGSQPTSRARVVDLNASSTEANRSWFGGDHAPARGATIGLRTILKARHILIVAQGIAKQDAVKAMVAGPVGVHCPASFLQQHPDTHLFLDEPAAGSVGDGSR